MVAFTKLHYKSKIAYFFHTYRIFFAFLFVRIIIAGPGGWSCVANVRIKERVNVCVRERDMRKQLWRSSRCHGNTQSSVECNRLESIHFPLAIPYFHFILILLFCLTFPPSLPPCLLTIPPTAFLITVFQLSFPFFFLQVTSKFLPDFPSVCSLNQCLNKYSGFLFRTLPSLPNSFYILQCVLHYLCFNICYFFSRYRQFLFLDDLSWANKF